MSNLSTETKNLKKRYREIFLKTSEELQTQISNIAPEDLPRFLDEEILKNVYEKWVKMLDYRKEFDCARCASCCKLACSEFSPQNLEQKAKEGDNYAKQFLSVFVPYDDEEDARKIYPEYFELLKEEAQDEKVYFYHCPKVGKDNCCPDYANRPDICKVFPDNPIGFLPKNCGYVKWKEEVEPIALMLRAVLEIVEFYKQKIKS